MVRDMLEAASAAASDVSTKLALQEAGKQTARLKVYMFPGPRFIVLLKFNNKLIIPEAK